MLETWIHVVISGARVLLTPKYLYKNIPEKITGADVFFDLIQLAAENNKSVYLVNDQLNSAQMTADLLQKKYPHLQVMVSQKSKDDPSLIADIKQAAPDMLFIAYGQPRQEKWIKQHLPDLPVKLAMGVGGTFDYAAGVKRNPPSWIRNSGLEWLFRLVTQPRRWRRIINATLGLIVSLVRFKVFSTFPYRSNASCVVVNNDNKIFLFASDPERIIKNGQYGLAGKKFWLFPQGGVKPHEDLIQSAKRELIEEANLANVEYLGTATHINKYDWTNGYRSLFLSRRLYCGQEQRTVFFRFLGDDSEIKLEDGYFSEWKWLSKEEVLATISPERRASAEIVLNELSQLIGTEL
ncbi:WecB/TagA/CpsF family glycosyltransferase [bacterium]|nr:MAG: WecB/TagA/CpsF family glycosyltransferase [bacterium]